MSPSRASAIRLAYRSGSLYRGLLERLPPPAAGEKPVLPLTFLTFGGAGHRLMLRECLASLGRVLAPAAAQCGRSPTARSTRRRWRATSPVAGGPSRSSPGGTSPPRSPRQGSQPGALRRARRHGPQDGCDRRQRPRGPDALLRRGHPLVPLPPDPGGAPRGPRDEACHVFRTISRCTTRRSSPAGCPSSPVRRTTAPAFSTREGDFLAACEVADLLGHAAERGIGVTEQTILAEANRQLGGRSWPEDEIALREEDRFSLGPRSGGAPGRRGTTSAPCATSSGATPWRCGPAAAVSGAR